MCSTMEPNEYETLSETISDCKAHLTSMPLNESSLVISHHAIFWKISYFANPFCMFLVAHNSCSSMSHNPNSFLHVVILLTQVLLCPINPNSFLHVVVLLLTQVLLCPITSVLSRVQLIMSSNLPSAHVRYCITHHVLQVLRKGPNNEINCTLWMC